MKNKIRKKTKKNVRNNIKKNKITKNKKNKTRKYIYKKKGGAYAINTEKPFIYVLFLAHNSVQHMEVWEEWRNTFKDYNIIFVVSDPTNNVPKVVNVGYSENEQGNIIAKTEYETLSQEGTEENTQIYYIDIARIVDSAWCSFNIVINTIELFKFSLEIADKLQDNNQESLFWLVSGYDLPLIPAQNLVEFNHKIPINLNEMRDRIKEQRQKEQIEQKEQLESDFFLPSKKDDFRNTIDGGSQWMCLKRLSINNFISKIEPNDYELFEYLYPVGEDPCADNQVIHMYLDESHYENIYREIPLTIPDSHRIVKLTAYNENGDSVILYGRREPFYLWNNKSIKKHLFPVYYYDTYLMNVTLDFAIIYSHGDALFREKIPVTFRKVHKSYKLTPDDKRVLKGIWTGTINSLLFYKKLSKYISYQINNYDEIEAPDRQYKRLTALTKIIRKEDTQKKDTQKKNYIYIMKN